MVAGDLDRAAPREFRPLSLHDALPLSARSAPRPCTSNLPRGPWGTRAARMRPRPASGEPRSTRSEEHTSELQSRGHLVCRLLLEKKKMTLSTALEHPRSTLKSCLCADL